MSLRVFRTIFAELIHDRVVQAGTGTSSVSLVGAVGVERHPLAVATAALAEMQPWIAFFAALFGGLSALATFVYVCLKIHRMVKNPRAPE